MLSLPDVQVTTDLLQERLYLEDGEDVQTVKRSNIYTDQTRQLFLPSKLLGSSERRKGRIETSDKSTHSEIRLFVNSGHLYFKIIFYRSFKIVLYFSFVNKLILVTIIGPLDLV